MKKQLTVSQEHTLAVQMLDMVEREYMAVFKEVAEEIHQDHNVEQQQAFVVLNNKFNLLRAERANFSARVQYFGSLMLAGFKTEKEAREALNRDIAKAMS